MIELKLGIIRKSSIFTTILAVSEGCLKTVRKNKRREYQAPIPSMALETLSKLKS
ncbi:MAG: hypothetical protein ACJ703_04495 [Nitrososphaera sp.]